MLIRQTVAEEKQEALRIKEEARQALINAERNRRLDYFVKNEERWVGSINFTRKGEIAEKEMLFMHPDDEPILIGDEQEPVAVKVEGNFKPMRNIEGAEYARLSANEKK